MMKKLIIISILTIFSVMIFSESLTAWDNQFNPALMNSKRRGFIEIGVTPDIMFFQNLVDSKFILDNYDAQEIVIDLDEFYGGLEGEDLKIVTDNNANVYGLVNLWKFGLGVYSNVDLEAKLSIPNSLLELLTQGNEIGQTYTDSGEVVLNSIVEAGAYSSFSWKDRNLLGVKVGAFLPIITSDKDASFEYGFSTDETTNSIEGELKASVPAYSNFNANELENLDTDMIMNNLLGNNGFKIDIGYINGYYKNPKWGVAVKNITLKKANLTKSVNINAEYTMEASNIVFDQSFETSENFEFVDNADVNKEYAMPIGVSGFYKFTFIFDLIPFVEWYPTVSQFNFGINAKSNIFNIIPYSFNLERDYDIWKAGFGIGLNTYLVETRLNVSLANSKLVNIFDLKGISAKINLAVGF
ncbi:MAG: hypothetical protein ACQESN_07385 [Thermotogota bacterium]